MKRVTYLLIFILILTFSSCTTQKEKKPDVAKKFRLPDGSVIQGEVIGEVYGYTQIDSKGRLFTYKSDQIEVVGDVTRVGSRPRIKEYFEWVAFNHWKNGVAQAVKAEFEAAKAEFQEALKVDPFNESIEICLSIVEDAIEGRISEEAAVQVFKSEGTWGNEAIEQLNQAIALMPDYEQLYISRGNIYVVGGKVEEAFSDFGKAFTINPDSFRAYLSRGLVYKMNGQLDEAISDYTNALRIEPVYPIAYVNRANVYYEKGLFEEALFDYTKAIEIDPRHAGAYLGRALAYISQNKLDEAVLDLYKIIEINSNYSSKAYSTLGGVAFLRRQFDEAIANYTKAIELNSFDSKSYVGRALVFSLKGVPEAQSEDFSFMDDFASDEKGNLLLNQGISDCSQAVEIHSDFFYAYLMRAFLYGLKKEFEKGISDCNAVIEKLPEYPDAFNLRAFIYYKKEDYEKALNDVNKSIELIINQRVIIHHISAPKVHHS
ncbi:MAG: tetratricopeptide repeat protein [Candidatus Omnitrophica bacterium]|nr:tetratricopeptide repeat protein [Candidatus Omnitrophota bacterium]